MGNVGDNVWGTLIEAGFTAEQILRLTAAVLLNKASGGNTASVVFRDIADTKNRVTLAVDSFGNRSSTTLDPS